jgi:hypothetical protein
MTRTQLLVAACVWMTFAAPPGAPQSPKKSASPLYTISGQITGMAPGRRATIVATSYGHPRHSATSRSDGGYTLRALVPSTYTIRPSHALYTFSPSFRTVAVTGHDVTDGDFVAHEKPKKQR